MSGTFFVIGTPIGNLGDITLRAVDTLKAIDFLVVEDTRVTIKLLNHLGTKKVMISYFRHSNETKLKQITERLLSGQNGGIVSDAGLPCISDPGEDLINECIKNEISVTVVPGVNAALTGLISSGLSTSKFCFEGFLAVNKKNRLKTLERLKFEERTIIFYEAPHKLKNTLNDLLYVWGNRRVSIARELTKLYEQILRTNLKGACKYFETIIPKGEFVLVVQGFEKKSNVCQRNLTNGEILMKAIDIKSKNNIGTTNIAKIIALETGLKKCDIYKLLISNEL